MIKFIKGNLFDTACHFMVNTVNLVKVQGGGIAKQFREWAPPEYFKQYVADCESGKLGIGNVTGFTFTRNEVCKTIINFPTKIHWKNPSLLEYIKPGLNSLAEYIYYHTGKDNMAVAIPKLGCGLGGLCWDDVKQIIKDWYCDLNFNLDVEVYV